MIKHPQCVTELARFRAKSPMDSQPGKSSHGAAYWRAQVAQVAIQRDRESFMRIYDFYAPRLHRYLGTLGAAESVIEELVQEALLKLWRKAHLFDPVRANLSTWLFRVTRNLYIDHVRREPCWLPEDDGVRRLDQDETRRADHRPELFAEQDLVRRAMAELPALQAKLIRMSFLESRSHSEIAHDLDMPLGTVKSTLRRALNKLQTRMGTLP